MTTDYERGFRDGLEKAVKVAQKLELSVQQLESPYRPEILDAPIAEAIRALKAPADDGTVRVPRLKLLEFVNAYLDDTIPGSKTHKVGGEIRAMIAQGEK